MLPTRLNFRDGIVCHVIYSIQSVDSNQGQVLSNRCEHIPNHERVGVEATHFRNNQEHYPNGSYLFQSPPLFSSILKWWQEHI